MGCELPDHEAKFGDEAGEEGEALKLFGSQGAHLIASTQICAIILIGGIAICA